MKRVLSGGVLLAAALAVSGCVGGDFGDWGGSAFKETVSESRPLAKDGHFTLENTNGRVELSGWDQENVSIEATKRAGSRHSLDQIRVEVEGEGSRVRVRTRYPRPRWLGGGGRVDYVVHLPRTARVSVKNVNGRVEVEGVGAPVEASTVNGSVEITEAAGEVEASVVNGSVAASLARVDPDGRSRLHSTNGSVRLTLPPDANAEIDAGTVNGGVSCDFDVSARRQSRRRLAGQIGSGGARFDLGTVNGSVSINRGLRAHAARTEDGDSHHKPAAEAEEHAAESR